MKHETEYLTTAVKVNTPAACGGGVDFEVKYCRRTEFGNAIYENLVKREQKGEWLADCYAGMLYVGFGIVIYRIIRYGKRRELNETERKGGSCCRFV